jgi:hypothetical protein
MNDTAETHYAQHREQVAATYTGAMERPFVLQLRDSSTLGPEAIR